ncbi:Rap1 [Acrasis kona]|uniref:small monomeric GTPase n=1 Tax=Acrasis kona TaxID=1008807 RepID=A0AAW2ZDB7_9EUKA
MNHGFDEYKVAVIGGGAVGKSAITVQYVQNQFVVEYDPTIEDSYTKHTKVDDVMVKLEILDTAGQEEFRSLRDMYMRSSHGFLCVYSIAELRSLQELQEDFIQTIYRVQDTENVPMVLFGNKCDIASEREVKSELALEFTKSHMGNCPFFEGSARKRINIDEAFVALVKEIRRRRQVIDFKPKNDKNLRKKNCMII